MRFSWIVWGLLALAGPASADGISGTYVGTGSNSAFLMQVVETAGGQLTGRYEQTVLQASGKLEQMNAAVTGVSDGRAVVVTIKPSELLPGSFTASGTIQGSLLHLSGGGDTGRLSLNLTKSDEASYRASVSALANQSRQINEARNQADQMARLNELTKKLIANSTAADTELGKFLSIEQRFRAITEWMHAALARQRSIYGVGQAGVARSQIGVAINQAAVEAEQLHGSVQAVYREMGSRLEPLLKDALDMKRRCQPAAPQQSANQQSSCAKFLDAGKNFVLRFDELAKAFKRAEEVWIEERRKQEGIIQASNVASR